MAGPYRETPWERIVAVHWGSDVTAWVVSFSSSGTAPVGETIPEIAFTLSTEGVGVFQEQVVDFEENGEGAFGSTYRIIGKSWNISGATEVRLIITPPDEPPAFGLTNATAFIYPGIYADGVVTADASLAFSLSAAASSNGTNATTPNEPPDAGSPPHPTGVTISGSAATLLWVLGDNPRLLP